MTRSGRLVLAALLALGAGGAPAWADGLLSAMVREGLSAQPAGAGADMPSARIYDSGTLNRDALKRCLVAAHTLDAAETQIEVTRADVQALKTAADRAEMRAEAAAKAKPRKDAVADVPLIHELNEKRHAFLVASSGFRAQIERRNEGVTAFNRDCAGRKFYASDLWAVRGDLPFDLSPFEPKP